MDNIVVVWFCPLGTMWYQMLEQPLQPRTRRNAPGVFNGDVVRVSPLCTFMQNGRRMGTLVLLRPFPPGEHVYEQDKNTIQHNIFGEHNFHRFESNH